MPAKLHHERIARSDTSPTQWLLLTHGIYGAGSNWRGIARKLVNQRSEWGVVLVDLRLHGKSEAGDPPHTIAACAEDVAALAHELGGVRALAGHSFGGKVMLATRAILEVDQTWMLDASPSPRPGAETDPANTVSRVLALMEQLPAKLATREEFVAAITGAGHSLALAQWLAMNLVASDGGYVSRLDLRGIRALLRDYYAQDLWASAFDPARGALEVTIAERSNTLTPNDRDRLAAAPPHVHVHGVAADHWLHIEAPDAVVAMFVSGL